MSKENNPMNLFFRGKSGGSISVNIGTDDMSSHILILGSTRAGKSPLLEAEAKRRGISYEELLRQMEPTEEQKEQARKMTEARKQKELVRLNAVREAYWGASDPASGEFDTIDDALREFCGIESATVGQRKKAFCMLPETILGAGIQWGFDDTEVRDSIWRFVEEKKAEIKEALG
jgi:hypothetical protein